jgi:acyl carrier protein
MKQEEIAAILLKYIRESNPVAADMAEIPVNESLYELGVLDSFGVIETVDFIEKRWSIKILDSEITKEKFGGINKMAALVSEKLKGHAD